MGHIWVLGGPISGSNSDQLLAAILLAHGAQHYSHNMARTKESGPKSKRSSSHSGSNRPSPARTGKDHRRSINRSPMKKDVMAQFSEVLTQIQCQLGSLDRTVRSQGEKQVEIEYRIDRKRGAEING